MLFPILIKEIPQKHKDSILDMLKSVSIYLFRKSTINQTILFPQFRDLTLPITQCSRSISCGEGHRGRLLIISFWRVSETVTRLSFSKRSARSGWTKPWKTAFGRCGTLKLDRDTAWRSWGWVRVSLMCFTVSSKCSNHDICNIDLNI